jgi:hypothetical protein
MLRYGRQNVDCEFVGVRVIDRDEFNPGIHQRGNERQIARKTVQRCNDELGAVFFAGRELWTITVLATLDLYELGYQGPAATVEVGSAVLRAVQCQ